MTPIIAGFAMVAVLLFLAALKSESRTILLLFALTAALIAFIAPAHSQTYLSAHGGLSLWDCTANSCEIESRRPGGYRVQGALGTRLSDHWSVEAEVSWQKHDIHGINPGDGRNMTGDGNTLEALSLMGNALLHLPEFVTLQPYALAGFGVTRQQVSPGGRNPLDDDMITLAGQVGLGARYPLTERLSLDSRYVYWRAVGSEVQVERELGNGLDLDHDSHSILVGVVWNW
jgi:opacity protein-like surface antigen